MGAWVQDKAVDYSQVPATPKGYSPYAIPDGLQGSFESGHYTDGSYLRISTGVSTNPSFSGLVYGEFRAFRTYVDPSKVYWARHKIEIFALALPAIACGGIGGYASARSSNYLSRYILADHVGASNGIYGDGAAHAGLTYNINASEERADDGTLFDYNGLMLSHQLTSGYSETPAYSRYIPNGAVHIVYTTDASNGPLLSTTETVTVQDVTNSYTVTRVFNSVPSQAIPSDHAATDGTWGGYPGFTFTGPQGALPQMGVSRVIFSHWDPNAVGANPPTVSGVAITSPPALPAVQIYTATVSGTNSPSQAVSWSLTQPARGTIDAVTGEYTRLSSAVGSADTVIATAQQDGVTRSTVAAVSAPTFMDQVRSAIGSRLFSQVKLNYSSSSSTPNSDVGVSYVGTRTSGKNSVISLTLGAITVDSAKYAADPLYRRITAFLSCPPGKYKITYLRADGSVSRVGIGRNSTGQLILYFDRKAASGAGALVEKVGWGYYERGAISDS